MAEKMKIAFGVDGNNLIATLEFERGAVNNLKEIVFRAVEAARPIVLSQLCGSIPDTLKFSVYTAPDDHKVRTELNRCDWVVLDPKPRGERAKSYVGDALKTAKEWPGDITYFEARLDEFNLRIDHPQTLEDLGCLGLSWDLEEQIDEVVDG